MSDRSRELEKAFGVAALAQDAVQTLLAILVAGRGKSFDYFATWKAEYSQAIGRDLDAQAPAFDKLAKLYGAPPGDARPAQLLYAIHAYFALVLKCLAAKAVDAPAVAAVAFASDDAARRAAWRRIENGEVFEAAGITNLLADDRFQTCDEDWPATIDRLVTRLAEAARDIPLASLQNASDDPLGRLHHSLLPRCVRQELGEYYTPTWLAEHLLDALDYTGDGEERLLDPSCGSGVFLLAAIRRFRRRRAAKSELLPSLLGHIAGIDLNPLAALAARTNYLLAVADLLPSQSPIEIPVYCLDAILGASDSPASRFCDRVDLLVGNPPWTAWDRLPAAVREATRPLWERYGLFSLSGAEVRHGGAKKDLSSLFLYACADRYLKRSGKLGFVITQTLFQSKGAGDGFRRFRLGAEGESLRVLRVDDFSRFQPFEDANNWASALVLTKGEPTTYPVPYHIWTPSKSGDDFQVEARSAHPIDPEKHTSPWLVAPAGLSFDPARLARSSDYRAQLGANAGGASGVYWLKIVGMHEDRPIVENFPQTGKRVVAHCRSEIEPDLLFPLLRWGDIARWRASPAAYLLLVQDPQTRTGIEQARLSRDFPLAYGWLLNFRPVLEARAAWRRYQEAGPFYSMYNVGAATLAPIKVVWRRMDKRINAAVAAELDDAYLGRRTPIPQETCSFVAALSTEEAHYLCAMLNSAPVNFLAIAHSVRGGKGFGTPSILDYLPIERYDASHDNHRQLADAGLLAHAAAAAGENTAPIEERIDELVANLWRLSPSDLTILRGVV